VRAAVCLPSNWKREVRKKKRSSSVRTLGRELHSSQLAVKLTFVRTTLVKTKAWRAGEIFFAPGSFCRKKV